MNLRDRYEREGAALWAGLARLSRELPRLEGLYGRDADTRIARLVQSAAFAFSVAQNRLADDGQALVRPLAAAALPECLRPRPAMTVVELSGAAGRVGAVEGVTLAARAEGERLPFQVQWPIALAPMALVDVRVDRLDARRQVLRLAIETRGGAALAQHLPDAVRLFLNLEPRAVAIDLIHALRAGRGASALFLDDEGKRLADVKLPAPVRWCRVDSDEPTLVSSRADRFTSGTLLRDLFAFPESFCFVDVVLPTDRPPGATRIELSLPLARVVEGAAGLGSEHLRLHCAPATNEFVAQIEPLPDSPREGSLRVADRPHAEILEVRSLAATSLRDAQRRTALCSWECPDQPHAFVPGQTYYTLEQRLGVEERTELRILFGRLDAFPSAPGGIVEGEVLASDGDRTSGLGLGDVGGMREGGVNVTRVTRSRRALLGDNHAWRVSAYARMPSGRLGRRAHLTTLMELHDRFGPRDEAVRVRRPPILGATQALEHELEDGVLVWGDRFVVDVAAEGSTDGELWLLGHLLQRALAERNEMLRFVRLELLKDGAAFAEYEPRRGARLPFPLG